jgi:hypothetical protein
LFHALFSKNAPALPFYIPNLCRNPSPFLTFEKRIFFPAPDFAISDLILIFAAAKVTKTLSQNQKSA